MGSIYWVWRFETSNTAQGSSGPRLLQLPAVNSVHKQVKKNYLGVFHCVPQKFMIVKNVFIKQLLP